MTAVTNFWAYLLVCISALEAKATDMILNCPTIVRVAYPERYDWHFRSYEGLKQYVSMLSITTFGDEAAAWRDITRDYGGISTQDEWLDFNLKQTNEAVKAGEVDLQIVAQYANMCPAFWPE